LLTILVGSWRLLVVTAGRLGDAIEALDVGRGGIDLGDVGWRRLLRLVLLLRLWLLRLVLRRLLRLVLLLRLWLLRLVLRRLLRLVLLLQLWLLLWLGLIRSGRWISWGGGLLVLVELY
jgi:hypothetical protein